jgi:ABC-type branched-subunit amino acid transport system ATPase component
MTVLENIKLGAFLRTGRRATTDLERVLDHFPKLRARLLGLAHLVVDAVCEIIRRLRNDGLTIMLAEHNVGIERA